jgi:VanZ family protein
MAQWPRRRVYWRWLLVLAYAGAIFMLSSMPGDTVPTVKVSDKLLHAVLFGGLAILVCRALRVQTSTRSCSFIAITSLLITVCYGITDEVHQLFVPRRAAELADVMADSLGALLAVWGWYKIGTRWPWLQ